MFFFGWTKAGTLASWGCKNSLRYAEIYKNIGLQPSKTKAEKYGIKEGDLIISINDATDKSLWRKVLMDVKKGYIYTRKATGLV